jgi:hypothetical protein
VDRPPSALAVRTLDEAVAQAHAIDGATLNERPASVAASVRALYPALADARRLAGRAAARERRGGRGGAASGRMPDFVLPDENGCLVMLRVVLVEGPVAISFNRGHWCPYCRISRISGTARSLNWCSK